MEIVNIKIVNFSMISHMAMSTKHSCLYKGIIEAKGHILHGKEIRKETHTKRNSKSGKFGNSKQYFYINEMDSPIFETVDEFCAHYNVEFKE